MIPTVYESRSIIEEATSRWWWRDRGELMRGLAATYGETALRSLDNALKAGLVRDAATYGLEVVGRSRGRQEFL